MKAITKLNKWANSHNPLFILDFGRWFLGGFLFMKGINFTTESQYLQDLLAPKGDFISTIFIYHYVTLAHLGGGVLIVFGLLTRISLAIQIPALVGAVAVNFFIAMNPQNLIEASATLLLSVFFLFVGSGKHSADYNLKMNM